MQTFYNTVKLSGEDLKLAVSNAKEQEEAISLIFQNCDNSFSPSRIMSLCDKAGHNWPITSIRRAITNLTAQGELIKTSQTAPGNYGKPEHRWIHKNYYNSYCKN